MREIKTLQEAQIVINELLDWKKKLETKDWDFHGLRIRNAGDGTAPKDYVTLEQLPTIPISPAAPDQFFTIVWTSNSIVAGQLVPSWVTGKDREGIPHEVWAYAGGVPSGGNFQINFTVNGTNLLQALCSVSNGSHGPAFQSQFTTPVPRISRHSVITPVIVNANGASIVSFGIVVKKDNPG